MPDNRNYGTDQTLPLPDPAVLSDKGAANASTLKREFEPAPANIPIEPGHDNATLLEAAGAVTLEHTLMGRFFQPFAFDDNYESAMAGYNPEHDIMSTQKNRGAMFQKEDADFLRTAKSPEGFSMRLQQLEDRDMRNQAISENPSAMGVAFLDPFDALTGGVVRSLQKYGRVASVAAGAAVNTVATFTPNTTSTAEDHALDIVGGALAGLLPFGAAEKSTVKQNTAKAIKEGKPWHPSKMVETFEGLKPEWKPKPGDKPSFMNGMLGGLKKFQSFYDEVQMLGAKGQELADRLLGRPFDDASNSSSASAVQRNFMTDAQVSIYHVEDAMKRAGLFQDITLDSFSTNQRNAIRAERERVSLEAQKWLHREWRNHKSGGGDLMYPSDPLVATVVKAYHESKFAENFLRRAKEAGAEGAAETKASRSYTSLVWNYDRVRDLINKSKGRVTIDDIAEAFGKQIVRQFGNFANSDAKSMGAQFLKTIQGDKTGDLALKLREWEINGLTREEVINTMRAFGFQEGETVRAADAFFGKPDMRSVGDVTKSLRQRLDWDLDEQFLPSGASSGLNAEYFSLGDFIEPDIYKAMNRYSLEMSSRIGMAKAGYTSGGAFQKALDEAADEAMKAGQSPVEVRATLDHLRELVLGRPIGDEMPEWVRTSNAIGSALALKNSGIYNIAEYGTLAAEYGYTLAAKEFLKTVGKSTLDTLDRNNWKDLDDIITGRLVADGRFRPVVTHLEDNFDSATGSFHETVQYAAQSVRFLNGSEYIRRHQIRMFAGLYQKTLEEAFGHIKADTVNKIPNNAAAKKLIDQGMSPDLLGKAALAHKQHGWNMEHWNQALVDELSTHALSTADSVVLAIRKGERPRIMDTMLGKVIFPFMSFVFSAHNKILRRNFHKDGVAGVAKVMAYQAPLAFLAAAAANVAAGKQWDEDFTNGVPKSISSIGLFSMPYDLISRGRMGGSFPGFAPVNSAVQLLSGPPDVQSALQDIPGVAVALPVNILAGALKQGNE